MKLARSTIVRRSELACGVPYSARLEIEGRGPRRHDVQWLRGARAISEKVQNGKYFNNQPRRDDHRGTSNPYCRLVTCRRQSHGLTRHGVIPGVLAPYDGPYKLVPRTGHPSRQGSRHYQLLLCSSVEQSVWRCVYGVIRRTTRSPGSNNGRRVVSAHSIRPDIDRLPCLFCCGL